MTEIRRAEMIEICDDAKAVGRCVRMGSGRDRLPHAEVEGGRCQHALQVVRSADEGGTCTNSSSSRSRRFDKELRHLQYVASVACFRVVVHLILVLFVCSRLRTCADSKAAAAVAFAKKCAEYLEERRAYKQHKLTRLFAQDNNNAAAVFKKERDEKGKRGVDVQLADLDQAKIQAATSADLDMQWCRAFVSCGIPAFVLRNTEFKKAVRMTIEHGKSTGWALPTERKLMGPVLDRLDKEVRTACILCSIK